MPTSLIDFKSEYRDRVLEILWRQWTALGVSGQGVPWRGSVIDPEALLLFSCTVARHDARLFDAMLEWLLLNGRFINVQRIKRILAGEGFAGAAVLRAIAAMIKTSANESKWACAAGERGKVRKEPELLFFLQDGRPLPVIRREDPLFSRYGFLRDAFRHRGVAERFRGEQLSSLLLRLRALIGVSARCEILAFLLLNNRGSPRAMARDCYYYPATMSKALAEMTQSGYIASRIEGRHTYYALIPETWRKFLIGAGGAGPWVVWARLFGALEKILIFLLRGDLSDQPPLMQASSLRRILRVSVVSQLDLCGLNIIFGDDALRPGEELIPFFIDRMRTVLDTVEQAGHGG